MTENKRYKLVIDEDTDAENVLDIVENRKYNSIDDIVDLLNRVESIQKGQELEIVRLHNLADTMSAVLRELGIFNVYNQEQIDRVKKKLKSDGDVE